MEFLAVNQCVFLNTGTPTAQVGPKPYPTLTAGDELRLTCIVNAPTVKITWKKDEHSMGQNADIDTRLDDKLSKLVIADVVEEDSGEYSCEAHNRAGIVAYSTVTIYVKRKLASLYCNKRLQDMTVEP